MRNFLLLSIISTLVIISCKEKDVRNRNDIVREEFEKILFDKIDDPKSYEFVDIKQIDSFTIARNISERKSTMLDMIKMSQKRLGDMEDLNRSVSSYKVYEDSDLTKIKHQILDLKKDSVIVDSLVNSLKIRTDEIVSYTYEIRFRGNNKFGAKILDTKYIQTGDSSKIINIADDKDHLFIIPNNFPGYKDFIVNT